MFVIQTKYGYYFRYRIPSDLTHQVGLKEIRRSLRTGRRKQALTMAYDIGNKVKRLMRTVRQTLANEKGHISMNLSAHKIQQLIDTFVRQSLKEEEEERIRPTKHFTEEQLDDKYQGYSWVQPDYREALALGRHVETMEHSADILLEEQGITIDKDSDSYHQLCREMLKASIRILEVEKQRTYGDYSGGSDAEVAKSIVGATEPLPLAIE